MICGLIRQDDVVPHETDEVVLVLEGRMEFEVNGEIFHPEVGVELMIPAKTMHSARNIGSSTSFFTPQASS